MAVVVEHDVPCRVRDGTVLRADVYRPDDGERHPVLLLRTPYGKHLPAFTHISLDPLRAAAAGYVVVLQDVRGRFASEGGDFVPYRDEFADGHDAVEWAAGLPSSNGRVGLYGVSYMGGATWQAAVTAPPALRAIAPTQAPDDQYVDTLWRGGALLWGTHLMWSLASLGLLALLRSRAGRPTLPADVVALVDDLDAFEDLARHLPPRAVPAGDPADPFLPYFYDTLAHPTRDVYYTERSTRDRHGDVRVPALILAGWHDLLLGGDLAHFTAMRRSAATEEARERTRLVVGPWAHGVFQPVVGEVDFGLRASGMLLDLREDVTAMHLRWFDTWLGEAAAPEPGEPRVKLFVMGRNRWRDEDDWPLARARATPWYLHPGGGLGPEPPPAGAEPEQYVYDPADPCPTRGGTLLMPRTYAAGPVDQTPLLARPDVLVWTSEPLDDWLEVTGPVRCVLHAATSAVDTDWVVKLCEVLPDGRTLNICDGILRARYRDGDWTRPALLEPDAPASYEIDLWATSIALAPGRRLRLLVTSSDFPRYDRNPNTGADGVDATELRPARQRVFCDAGRASHVVLPVVP